ncbi:hypothetical protein ABZ897_38950 [Nonomuraea sp. NPDC046802]|uniref:hypothetical protein n=1 Tax=Nonomuraea sp. NPDC046802 TaxID=3154919 RepID=UPI0033F93EE9
MRPLCPGGPCNRQFDVSPHGLITGRVDAAHGGDDEARTGYGVWDRGAWASVFGDVAG